ncbi:hypothetical protein TKK_0003806 [Trichogramma kaykai]|uniref:Ankyrin repeat protein n=1 Tax=Trichogramma kaykai TaxID=54128 RepID=A0ABD2XNQ5_9HYME
MSGKKNISDSKLLNYAIERGNLDLMILLLENCADPNEVNDEGMAPLNLICNQLELSDVHLKMIQQLIKFKAKVNINKNLNSNSPTIQLFSSKRNGKLRYEALKILVENNADIMLANR